MSTLRTARLMTGLWFLFTAFFATWAYAFISFYTHFMTGQAYRLYETGSTSMRLWAPIGGFFVLWPFSAHAHYEMIESMFDGWMWWMGVARSIATGDTIAVRKVERQRQVDWCTRQMSLL